MARLLPAFTNKPCRTRVSRRVSRRAGTMQAPQYGSILRLTQNPPPSRECIYPSANLVSKAHENPASWDKQGAGNPGRGGWTRSSQGRSSLRSALSVCGGPSTSAAPCSGRGKKAAVTGLAASKSRLAAQRRTHARATAGGASANGPRGQTKEMSIQFRSAQQL